VYSRSTKSLIKERRKKAPNEGIKARVGYGLTFSNISTALPRGCFSVENARTFKIFIRITQIKQFCTT
jgi:hypothetical protein